MLKLKNVSVAFKDKTVLDNLSLTARKGEIIGLVAPNGTGKTTLFNVMANFLKPDKGKVAVKEKYSYKSEKDELRIHEQLTTFPDQGDLYDELSGLDHLKLYAGMWKGHTKHITDVVESLQMGSFAKKKVGTYSLGMRQRLCFAMMVAADSSIMLMDEVMNGLDVTNVSLISSHLDKMKQDDKLIFVASHLLENLDLYADRVLFLKDGKIIHEQWLDEESKDYIKMSIEPEEYEKLKVTFDLPDDHLFVADHLLCLPLEGMKASDQTKWIERLLSFKDKEMIVGPLGTVENYEKYYIESS